MMIPYDKLSLLDQYTQVSSREYLDALNDEILANFPRVRSLTVEKDIEDFVLDENRAQPRGILLNELLTNGMK